MKQRIAVSLLAFALAGLGAACGTDTLEPPAPAPATVEPTTDRTTTTEEPATTDLAETDIATTEDGATVTVEDTATTE